VLLTLLVVGMGMNNGEGSEGGALRRVLYMWGYLPGALPQRTPLLTPVAVRFPPCSHSWNDVCGGGCGFAIAISGALSFHSFNYLSFLPILVWI